MVLSIETPWRRKWYYPATIVTSQLYSRETFIEEAERLGVWKPFNPRVARRLLHDYGFGTPILTCDFTTDEVRRCSFTPPKVPGKPPIRGNNYPGILTIFGYFMVERIGIICSPEIIDLLIATDYIALRSRKGRMEKRIGGNIKIEEEYAIERDANTILDEILSLQSKKYRVEKLLLGGRFKLLKRPIEKYGIRFFRGIMYLHLPTFRYKQIEHFVPELIYMKYFSKRMSP